MMVWSIHNAEERTLSRGDGEGSARGARGPRWRARWAGVLALLVLAGDATAVKAASAWGDPSAPAARDAAADEVAGAVDEAGVAAGRAALAAASASKQAAYKLSGDAKESALLEAAQHYGAVADEASHGVHERAEGAFRAGELLRARGQVEQAVERFVQAMTLGRGAESGRAREFAARGLLEQAHVLRRDDRSDEAVALYRRVAADFPDQDHVAAQGTSWACKLLLRLDRVDEAGVLAQGFAASHPSEPVEAVRTVDEWAAVLVQDGRLDEARAAVERLRAELEPVTSGDDEKMAQRVADALAALRVTVSLSDA